MFSNKKLRNGGSHYCAATPSLFGRSNQAESLTLNTTNVSKNFLQKYVLKKLLVRGIFAIVKISKHGRARKYR